MNLLLSALEVETDSGNAQMLLGGLIQSVEDSACCEKEDSVTQPDNSSGFYSSGVIPV